MGNKLKNKLKENATRTFGDKKYLQIQQYNSQSI